MNKKKSRLNESIYDYDEYFKPMKILMHRGVELFGFHEYAELGVLLGFLSALRLMHHCHHWQTEGCSSYGDHLLYERLYTDIDEEIDKLGEKILGVGAKEMTNYFAIMEGMKVFLQAASKKEGLPDESLRGELMFVVAGELALSALEKQGILTRGIEQAIGDMLDKHETHIYLLQQRVDAELNQV